MGRESEMSEIEKKKTTAQKINMESNNNEISNIPGHIVFDSRARDESEASVSLDDIKRDNNNKAMRSICRCSHAQSSQPFASTLMWHGVCDNFSTSKQRLETMPNRNPWETLQLQSDDLCAGEHIWAWNRANIYRADLIQDPLNICCCCCCCCLFCWCCFKNWCTTMCA